MICRFHSYIQANKMSNCKPLSLSAWCRQSIAKAMFDRLINESNISSSGEMLLTFVTSKLLPRSTLLDVMRIFILTLDKGHARFSGEQKDCKNANCKMRLWVETKHSPDCPFAEKVDKSPEWRFRAMALSRHCTYVVMATWTDDTFSPSCLVERSFPISLSLTMRQRLVMYSVEGFLLCNDICQLPFPVNSCVAQDDQNAGVYLSRHTCFDPCSLHTHANNTFLRKSVKQICDKVRHRQQRHPLKTLDLRNENGNVHCTRAALTALKLALEPTTDKNENLILPLKKEQIDFTMPSIKLEMAVIGSSYDWFSDVLLSILRKSYINGFAVDLASIRFEDVCSSKVEQILQTLVNPWDIRKLEFRHVYPKSIFETKKGLSRLVNLEEFSLASCDRQPIDFTFNETCTIWNNIFVHWTKLKIVEFSRIRMSFCDNTNSIQDNGLHLPDSLISLEFADGSITPEAMEWLTMSNHSSQSFPGKGNMSALPSLRLHREFTLTNNLKLWKRFLPLFAKSLSSIRSFCVDHCDMKESHAHDMANLMKSQAKYSSLRCFIIREPGVSWKSLLEIFDAVLSTVPDKVSDLAGRAFRGYAELSYFSALVPCASDKTVPKHLRNNTNQEAPGMMWTNPSCRYESFLTQHAKSKGITSLKVEMFWEPECDWR
ncbi:uncharacterized protein LOC143468112 isoform X2 [Clavelina lepadiformis]|uniref:uncharacterized protein LOC143468112 isoform X2 n=1 Tax=Clavelina lepadiformis TaxID=159417 RepID=UPI0040420D22